MTSRRPANYESCKVPARWGHEGDNFASWDQPYYDSQWLARTLAS